MYRIKSGSECICLGTFLASVICLAIGHSAHGQSDDAQTVAAIIKSLHSLDDEVKAVNFTMATKVFTPADSSLHPSNLRPFGVEEKDLKKSKGVDVDYDAKHIIKIDGDKIYRFSESPEGFPAVVRNSDHVRTYIETDNGKEARTLRTSTVKGRFPQGTISSSSPQNGLALKTTAYQPVFYLCCPKQSDFFQGDGLSVSPGEAFGIEGKQYVQLESKWHGMTNEFLVSVGDDCRIISRVVKLHDGTPFLQLEITYEETDKYGPIPMAWSVKKLDRDGRLNHLSEISVLAYEINPKFPLNEFTIEFPAGTWVTDEMQGIDYIVRSDGSKRLITMAEKTASLTYEQLLNSETGEVVPAAELGDEKP